VVLGGYTMLFRGWLLDQPPPPAKDEKEPFDFH
jgi:hypothetical protein